MTNDETSRTPKRLKLFLPGACFIGCIINAVAFATQMPLYGGYQLASGVAVSLIFFDTVSPGSKRAKMWCIVGSMLLVLCAVFVLWQKHAFFQDKAPTNRLSNLIEYFLIVFSALVFGILVGFWWWPFKEVEEN